MKWFPIVLFIGWAIAPFVIQGIGVVLCKKIAYANNVDPSSCYNINFMD